MRLISLPVLSPFNAVSFVSQGVDITPGDLKGLSTRITDESEEKIELMRTDQQAR